MPVPMFPAISSGPGLPPRRAATWGVMTVCLLSFCGCAREEPIREYVVKRPPVRGSLWFFKLLGPQEQVSSVAAPFRAFVESVTFDERTGLPQWRLPQGWSEQASDGSIRYRTLRLGGETSLEVAVTQVAGRVPPSADEVRIQADLLREQVGVQAARQQAGALGEATVAPAGEVIESFAVGPYTARWFDFAGETARFGRTRLVTAMIAVPVSPRPATAPSSSDEALPFTYTRPPEWQDAPQTGFSVVSMTAGAGDQTAAITITPAAGGLLANVNRWRNQAGLSPLEQEQLEDHLQTVDAGGKTLLFVEAIGESRAILGGVLTTGQRLWFIKLDGAPAVVEQERERFRAFLESIRVP
jgi:hypothetical protein